MLRFHDLVMKGSAEAIEARDRYRASSDKQRFNDDIVKIVRLQGNQKRRVAEVPAGEASESIGTSEQSGDTAKPVSTSIAKNSGKKVCRNFLKGACNRGSSCKFEHTLSTNTPSVPEVKPEKRVSAQTEAKTLREKVAPSNSKEKPQCKNCGVSKRNMRPCSSCGKVRYCSRKCHDDDNESHKAECSGSRSSKSVISPVQIHFKII